MSDLAAFFELHSDLPREGPGEPDDVAWAVEYAGTKPGAAVLDAGCGPGGDIVALKAAIEGAQITAMDTHAPFADAAQRLLGTDDKAICGDAFAPESKFDLIWCAGAIYFKGVKEALAGWRESLNAGGAIAFSAPCYFTEPPTAAAQSLWEGEVDIPGLSELRNDIASAGFALVASRQLSDAAWMTYFSAIEKRAAKLEATTSPALLEVIRDARREELAWRSAKSETGYLACVVKPR